MVAFYRSLSTTPLRLSAKRFRRRFYKSVSVTTTNDSQSHQINLDRHALRTPAGMPLLIRSEPLALCVAAEWDTQGRRIRHDRMHLTKLCNTAQDDPQLRDRQQIVADLLQQLDADTLCYRADDGSDLSALQAQLWDPLVHRVERRFQVEIGWSSALAGPTIPLGTRERFRRWLLAGFDRWALIGVAELVGELRSVVLSVALIERFVEVEEAVRLSRLEVDYQATQWGRLESAHGVDEANVESAVAAALVFVILNSESVSLVRRKPDDSSD